METYLREVERSLHLDPEETRAIVAEVRANLEDLATHLRAQGYQQDEADREAVRRFDDARGLATALRRAHRRAPLPLHLLALALFVVGIAVILLGADVLVTAAAVALHSDGQALAGTAPAALKGLLLRLPWGSSDTLSILAAVLPLLTPGTGILALGAGSLWAAMAAVLGQRRPRWRRIGAFVGALALCNVALALVLAQTLPAPAETITPLPGGARLAAAGLCFYPGPAARARPVVVDRLCADRTATYVQYHIPNAPSYGEPQPSLYDDRMQSVVVTAPYRLWRCTACTGPHGQAIGGLRQLVPWRPVDAGVAQFAPLDDGVRAAVLRFSSRALGVQTVRIPVKLRPWRRVGRGVHPFIRVSARGVRVNLTSVVRGLTMARLTYTVDTTRTAGVIENLEDVAGPQIRDRLTDGQGRVIAGAMHVDNCEGRVRGGSHCAPEIIFPLQPAGTRLTLTIRSVTLASPPLWQAHAVGEPWRILFVMP